MRCLSHPTRAGVTADYGYTHDLGYFVDINSDGNSTEMYNRNKANYKMEEPFWGALGFLGAAGFFEMDDAMETLIAIDECANLLLRRDPRIETVIHEMRKDAYTDRKTR